MSKSNVLEVNEENINILWDLITNYIEEGDIEQLKFKLKFTKDIEPRFLEEVFRINFKKDPVRHYPLTHYCLTINKDSIESLLKQKQIGDLLMSYDLKKDRLDYSKRTYDKYKKTAYNQKLVKYLVQSIRDNNYKETQNFLELIKKYDPATLTEILRTPIRTEESKDVYSIYPLPHYCLNFNNNDTYIELIERKKLADLLIKYGADPKQKNSKDQDFEEYKFLKYFKPLWQEFIRTINEDSAKSLKEFMEILDKDQEILKEILQSDVIVTNPGQASVTRTLEEHLNYLKIKNSPEIEEKIKLIDESNVLLQKEGSIKPKSPSLKRASFGEDGLIGPKSPDPNKSSPKTPSPLSQSPASPPKSRTPNSPPKLTVGFGSTATVTRSPATSPESAGAAAAKPNNQEKGKQ